MCKAVLSLETEKTQAQIKVYKKFKPTLFHILYTSLTNYDDSDRYRDDPFG